MTNLGIKTGGIVLCGGQSKRMGKPKHMLPFGKETLLQRVVRISKQVVDPVVVVAAAEQTLPALPEDVIIIRDEQPHQGPLYGLASGLAHLQQHCDAVYLTGCDVPLLKPEFVLHMIDALQNYDIAIPQEDNFYHPLAAVYRTSLSNKIFELLESGCHRPFQLVEAANTHTVAVEELRPVDPQLCSLRNLNSPDDYQSALAEADI